MVANDDLKTFKVMCSLMTLRYQTMVQILFLCPFDAFEARAFQPERSKHEHGAHPETALGSCKLCVNIFGHRRMEGRSLLL